MVLQIRSVFFFQTFKDGIRQFLRGNFCPDVFRVLLRIVVTPVIIFVLRDLTTPETDGLFFPCCEVFADLDGLFCLILAESETGHAVYFINSQSVGIFQCKPALSIYANGWRLKEYIETLTH